MKNLENEFMHGYGQRIVGLRITTFNLLAATYEECNLTLDEERSNRILTYLKTKRISYEKFIKSIGRFIEISSKLNWIIKDKISELNELSDLFQENIKNVGTIEKAAKRFENYLSKNACSKTYPINFKPYSGDLVKAHYCIEDALKTINTYDLLVDGSAARRNWVQSHPEFNKSLWKPSN